ICKKCSGDSLGRSPGTAGYVPTVAGPVGFADSSGVHPNLTFNINGFDYYSTGDILYTGQWIKKGFTYLTGPAQTQMVINIRNNAPGGGGNDWAMDDIGVATCTPNLDLNPTTATVNLCYGNATTLSANVKSYFNNYTQYIWEKSSDNGATYTGLGFSGTGTPVYNGTEYTYTAAGPSFIGDSTTNKNIYRLRVASTASNITDPNCSFAALRTVQVFVNNCMWLLKANFVQFNGTLSANKSALQWTVVNEIVREVYEVERSTDGVHFTTVGKLAALNGMYNFTDPESMAGLVYYRIKMTDDTQFKYSKIIVLSQGKVDFAVKDLINPFTSNVSCSVILPADGDLHLTLFDMYGRPVKKMTQNGYKGMSAVSLKDLGSLSGGSYYLKIEFQEQSITKKLVKTL
ncbi:MAG TPA: T9SS type A sorting domain-containing protein, partial [Chitinophagaceae bacterium]|nr:T9SS type A sorting domain-containing protein [Chitinophagaceae bacterium]